MPPQRRTISSARDLQSIDQVLRDRQNPPRPKFTTLYHKRADLTPPPAAPIAATQSTIRTPRASSANVAPTSRTTLLSRSSVRSSPRTPAPATNTAANRNFAMLVVRDVSRQPQNAEAIRFGKVADQYQVTANRRYNMVVDEAELEDNLMFAADGEAAVRKAADLLPVRRLIKPVSKGGLRSEYYIPNRKHTLSELRQSTCIGRDRVRQFAKEKGWQNQSITQDNAAMIVDFLGKGHRSLGTVALINKAFAAEVERKLAEKDDTASPDEVLRRLNVTRAAVSAIPKAFFNAIKTLRTNPPVRVMEALQLVISLTEIESATPQITLFDGPAATAAFRARLEANGGASDALVSQIVDLDPLQVPTALITVLLHRHGGLEELAEAVTQYNPHAGTLVKWASSVVNMAQTRADPPL